MVTSETPQDLRTRTTDFALRIVRLYSSLPKTTEAQTLGKQALRSGTSIGAHYREGHRAKSDADIVNKFESALQELDETDYWLDLLVRAGIVPAVKVAPLINEVRRMKDGATPKEFIFHISSFILFSPHRQSMEN